MADGTAKGRLPSKQGGENRGSELPVPSPSCVPVSDCKKRLLPNPFVSGSQLLVLFLLQNITLCCKMFPRSTTVPFLPLRKFYSLSSFLLTAANTVNTTFKFKVPAPYSSEYNALFS